MDFPPCLPILNQIQIEGSGDLFARPVIGSGPETTSHENPVHLSVQKLEGLHQFSG